MGTIDSYRLYGVRGWGSAVVEACFALAGIEFSFVDVSGFDEPGAARDRLLALNPLAQVPTLVLPDGKVMTESAAIALLLAERYPEAGIAPKAGGPGRAAFLRRLVWLVANLYPTFIAFEYPERWTKADPELFKSRVLEQRNRLWLQLEQDLQPDGGWVLGDCLSALDIYVAVMTRWGPGRTWFESHCPSLHAIARRADVHGALGPVLARNFPGEGG